MWHLVVCALHEVVDPLVEYEVLEGLYYWFGLHVQVAQHLVQAPLSNKFNGFVVDSGTEEGHGACGL